MKTTLLFTVTIAISLTMSTAFAQPPDTTLTITNTGNVGIGTTVPSQKLQVVGGAFGVFNDSTNRGLTINHSRSGVVDVFTDYLDAITGEPKLHLSSFSDWTGTKGITIQSGIPTVIVEGRLDVRQNSGQRLMDFRDASDTRMGWISLVSGDDLQICSDDAYLMISSPVGVEVTNEAATEYRPITASQFKVVNATIHSGTGSPQGVVSGNVGDLFLRTDGGTGSTFYVKESGNGTTTGWVAK